MTVTVNASRTWKEGEREWLLEHVGDLGYGWTYGETVDDKDIQEMIFAREEDAALYTLKWVG